MKILAEYPPNYSEIKSVFNKCEEFKPVFAYGDTIYNPFEQRIPEDLIVHEQVHLDRQKAYTSPQIWWTMYLSDKGFRLEEELLAYTRQLEFVKIHIPKAYKEALDEFSINLASIYNLDITRSQAETLIRLKLKQL